MRNNQHRSTMTLLTTTLTLFALGGLTVSASAFPGNGNGNGNGNGAPQQIVLTGFARDFLASHEDFDTGAPDQGFGHYAGNVSQILGADGAPLQVHGVNDFVIDFGSLIPGVPYAARLTVLGSEITSGGNPIPVTIETETDSEVFEPFGLYLDPGGQGNVNDGANPRHFIYSLDDIYSESTPISVTATSWLPNFSSQDAGETTVLSTGNQELRSDHLAMKMTLPEDGTVTSITAYLYRALFDSNDIRYAIYSDNGGEPDALIVQTGQGNQSLGWGWETLGITDTWLAAGDYWLAVSTDNQNQEIRYQTGTGGEMRRITTAGVDGMDSPWGPSFTSWSDQSMSIYLSFTADTPTYAPHLTAKSGDNSPQVIVLRNGSTVPSIPAFQDQASLAVFVEPYVNVATQKIVLQDNQAIYLFELGTTNLSSSAADFQDLVIMVTLATDPVYFFDPGSTSSGLNPIGYKVASQWEDADGNNIAPHTYMASFGDWAGASGVTSSGGVTSPATYYEWFRDILGENMGIPVDITLTDDGDGVYEFETANFHPIDGLLYGNEGSSRNDNFTYSVAADFTYDASAGQFLDFEGGDGVWIFIDGKLVIDLGGVKSDVEQHFDIDRLGLVDGQDYEIRLFYASRGSSNEFRVRTNVFLTPGPILGSTTGSFD